MSSRVEKELTDFRISLQKDLEDKSILDILEILKNTPVTVDLLRTTQIGLVLQDLKNKYQNKEIGIVILA